VTDSVEELEAGLLVGRLGLRARAEVLYPERLAGDSAYGSGEMLEWLVHERGIEPAMAT
jgi:hypothetical protein